MIMKKIFISIAIVLAILVGGFFAFNSYIYNEKQADEELTQEQIQTLVTVYITENISTLSPESEVLGGTFYVTNIEFIDQDQGVVEYEDGHIALRANFVYTVYEEGVVNVTFTNTTEL